ncbi:unnamed protein product [Nippostrongylus brasiliensis]|uniref:Meis_PKNOX_N domain-containing protein n=1 Tax=Nippostrongylus brasiliensis TaxID=27835 RepID=A0A0N4XUN6_NIPBR|nr:unnamed protein product [Nippostrongylus brasiliensis]
MGLFLREGDVTNGTEKVQQALARLLDETKQKGEILRNTDVYCNLIKSTTDSRDLDVDADNNDGSMELNNIEGLIEHCSNLIEAKYLMQHLFNACLEHAVAAAKADSHNKGALDKLSISNVTVDADNVSVTGDKSEHLQTA